MKKPNYKLFSNGEFVIENYNSAKPFANFFPGIAGPYGIPIWAFYVNRGQAISSFGTKDKDHAILEFLPANKAWQMTPLQGFRSFIKLTGPKKALFYEPFADSSINFNYNLSNAMRLTSYDLKLEEHNSTLGLKTSVEYFTVPNDNYGGLIRIITLKNTGTKAKKIQFIDGLPQIIPYGENNFFLKEMSRTIESWVQVENLQHNAPFYKLAVDPQDRPEVVHIQEGNFYLAFSYDKNKTKIFTPIIDPKCIFGPVTDFSYPERFLNTKNFSVPKNQFAASITPCGFLFSGFELAAKEQKTFFSITGYMLSRKILNSSLAKITQPGYLEKKRQENKNIIENLQSNIDTESSQRNFDLYAKQTYLDNLLRGGYPVTFSKGLNKTVFYLYSRKHGDLERDYNKFQIQPTYFSQGNGNYRDVNQNRRSDIWFNPEIEQDNIVTFFNLLQTDGFNPLVVKGVNFTLKNPADFKSQLKQAINENNLDELFAFLQQPFTPGEVILFIEKNKFSLKITREDFLNLLFSNSIKNEQAEHGEGFWTDHWTYNLDLLESYLGVYPEKLQEILLQKKCFTFFDNSETVKPRSKKYLLYDGKVKQLHSIGPDNEKKEIIRKRPVDPHIVRTLYGLGDIYRVTLINKLLCLSANKMASLDPFGSGIEMEADKPNWYDSLNGLPALSGSSTCETFELKRLLIFIKNNLKRCLIKEISVSEDIFGLLTSINELIKIYPGNNTDDDYLFWDKSHTAKEDYRLKTRFGLSGNEIKINSEELIQILNNFLRKLEIGLNKALDKKKNIYYAYFINEVTEYQPLKQPQVMPLKFKQIKLPFFLEAQVHAFKISDNAQEAKIIYDATKKSALFDKKLKMYKVTAPLSAMPEEIGRCRVFNPGWLENESIWLHMEYKFLLEILRSGLYEDFYREFKNLLIPFQKPQVYGRSILENSSFLVSSAFPDQNLHGNGFVARLSGSTAEFLSLWLMMNTGTKPFFLNEKTELNLKLIPILAGWLFDQDGIYSFNFLGSVKVVYCNPKRINTFGKNGAKISNISFTDKDNHPVNLTCDTIPYPYAQQIRSRQIKEIKILLKQSQN